MSMVVVVETRGGRTSGGVEGRLVGSVVVHAFEDVNLPCQAKGHLGGQQWRTVRLGRELTLVGPVLTKFPYCRPGATGNKRSK